MKFKLFINHLQIGTYDTSKELSKSLSLTYATHDVCDIEVKRGHEFYVTVDEDVMIRES